MPAPYLVEFRRRAVELARLRDRRVALLAEELGISESCLCNWMNRSDADTGRSEGLVSAERREVAELRCE